MMHKTSTTVAEKSGALVHLERTGMLDNSGRPPNSNSSAYNIHSLEHEGSSCTLGTVPPLPFERSLRGLVFRPS